jgi:hypothetical protein
MAVGVGTADGVGTGAGLGVGDGVGLIGAGVPAGGWADDVTAAAVLGTATGRPAVLRSRPAAHTPPAPITATTTATTTPAIHRPGVRRDRDGDMLRD